MRVNPLPDPDRRHLLQFHVLPRMTYGPRIAIALPAITLGLLIQALAPETVPFLLVAAPSLALVAAGNALLLMKGYDARPHDRIRSRDGSQKGEWEKTTRERLLAVRRLEKEAVRWDRTFADITCGPGFFLLLVLGSATLVVFLILMSMPGMQRHASFFAWDAAILILPHWLTGLRRAWRPVGLGQQALALETALEAMDAFTEPPCQIQPMFLTAGEKAGAVPLAARIFVRFPDGPEDFLGVQFQVALNDVQGTKYPYLYAVLVARPAFGLLKHNVAPAAGGAKLTIEKKKEDEVDVIVIRQHTTRQSGYHTKPDAIRCIVRTAWHAAAKMIA